MLQMARRYRIDGKFKVGRPCFIWEDTLRKEASKVGTLDKLDAVMDDDFDMKEVENIIFAADISEEEEDDD